MNLNSEFTRLGLRGRVHQSIDYLLRITFYDAVGELVAKGYVENIPSADCPEWIIEDDRGTLVVVREFATAEIMAVKGNE